MASVGAVTQQALAYTVGVEGANITQNEKEEGGRHGAKKIIPLSDQMFPFICSYRWSLQADQTKDDAMNRFAEFINASN